jgi:transcriptional regulator with XRE-family HTH domain
MLRLQAERERRGLTRKQLAEVALLSNGRVGAFELGRAAPPLDGVELLRLAFALGLPLEAAPTLLDEVDDLEAVETEAASA